MNALRRVPGPPVLHALLVAVLASSCLNDANLTRGSGPTPGAARLALSTVVADPAGKWVEIGVFYTRVSGERVTLPSNPTEVAFNNVQVDVPVTVDLSSCMSDTHRLGATVGTACQLSVKLRLLDGQRAPIDSNTTPATPTPGEVVRVSPPPLGGPAALPRFTVRVQASTDNAGPGRVTGNGLDCSITGTTTSGTCNVELPQGTAIGLTAQGTNNNALKAWSAPCGSASACNFTLTSNSNVSVGFTAPSPTSAVLTVNAANGNVGPGRVTGNGIDCVILGTTTSGTCNTQLAKGSVVTLTAQGTGGNALAAWGGPCSGTGPCSFTLSTDVTVTAGFTAASRTLTVQAAAGNAGSGQVSGNGLDCAVLVGTTSGSCSVQVTPGTVVSLSARGTSGNSLGAWSGPCSGQASCTFTMPNSDVAVGVAFTAAVATLSVSPSTKQIMRAGQSFILTALPKDVSGAVISGRVVTWSVTAGDPSVVQLSATSSTTTTAGASITVTALNKAGTATVSASVDGKTASVDVAVSLPQPASIVLTGGGSDIYVGQPITVTATVLDSAGVQIPNAAITWSVSTNLSLSNATNLSATATGLSTGFASITATSVQVGSVRGITQVTVMPGPTIGLSLQGTGSSGKVTSSPSGVPPISCTLTAGAQSTQGCSGSFVYGTRVTFQAATTSAQNSYLAGWSGCESNPTGVSDASCLITATSSQPVTARFSPCSTPTRLSSAALTPGQTARVSGWLSDADCVDSFGNRIDNYQFSVSTAGLHKATLQRISGSGLDATAVELRQQTVGYYYQPGNQPEIYGLFPGGTDRVLSVTLPQTSPNSTARGAFNLIVDALSDVSATALQCVDIVSATSGLSNVRLGGSGCAYTTHAGVQTRGIRLYAYLSVGTYSVQLNAPSSGAQPLVELEKWSASSPTSVSFVKSTQTATPGSAVTLTYAVPTNGGGWHTIWLTSQASTAALGPFTLSINPSIGF